MKWFRENTAETIIIVTLILVALFASFSAPIAHGLGYGGYVTPNSPACQPSYGSSSSGGGC